MFIQKLKNPTYYLDALKYSDKVVLLSEKFITPFLKYAKYKNEYNFEIIPNALSYDSFLPFEQLLMKKKQVLIVSRLEETQKRISLALKIWSKVKESSISKDWKLIILGDGPNRIEYENMVIKHKIPEVKFYGKKQPKEFYTESSIFLMTSSSEGWGLTLTEAQQFGCVPIAFDAYSSISDIIKDNINGCIIENNNTSAFVDKLIFLMKNDDKRRNMAINAIEVSKQFEQSRIGELWHDLILKNSNINQ